MKTKVIKQQTGDPVKPEKPAAHRKRTGKGRRVLAGLCLLLILAVLIYWMGAARSRTLVLDEQTVYSEKLSSQAGILMLADLHSDAFGDGNEYLLDLVSRQADKAQIIVLGGDIIDDEDSDPSDELELCRKLRQIRPVYYFPGNSELAREGWPGLMEDLEAMEIPVLDQETVHLSLSGNDVILGGLYDYSFALNGKNTVEEEQMDPATVSCLQTMRNDPGFRLMVSHRPDSFLFSQSGNYWDLDLVLSGHTHGGQVVLPVLGGIWAPDQGWFPETVRGQVFNEDLPVVISPGLSSGRQKLPRWNNPGTVTLVTLKPGTSE